jgi:hypothetical protein
MDRMARWRNPNDRPVLRVAWFVVTLSHLLTASALGSNALLRGRALFRGQKPLEGRIRDHRDGLPPETVRCRNCHVVAGQPLPERAIAPRLDRSLLLSTRSRRGGPPSAYGPESFCKLLRTGVDPVYILIARSMPIYDVDDSQCRSLWLFLVER